MTATEHSHDPIAIHDRLERAHRPSYLYQGVLGAIDGCVTTFAIVCGALGAGFPGAVAVVLGFANLVADGFSMAVGNYEGMQANQAALDNLRRAEEHQIDNFPAGEREEVRQIFQRKGFSEPLLSEIVSTIANDRTVWVNTMLREEYGMQLALPDPWKSSALTFATFVIVGCVPLLPLVFSYGAQAEAFVLSAGLTALMFACIGACKGIISGRSVIASAGLTLVTGSCAAILAYVVGNLAQHLGG